MQQRAETYYYGQGKVLLSPLDAYGKPGIFRWIGDVSALQIALSTENMTHKESYTGLKSPVRRLSLGNEGTVTATWHEHSPENLAIVLYGQDSVIPSGTVTGEALPTGIVAGSCVALAYQNVSDVVIDTLVVGTDYEIDVSFGTVTFLTTPATPPATVNYKYDSVVNSNMFTVQNKNYALRFEGINLAENGAPVLVELYKLAFDPASALSLINNDTSLAGLETTAGILLDTTRPADSQFGRFGRIVNITPKE